MALRLRRSNQETLDRVVKGEPVDTEGKTILIKGGRYGLCKTFLDKLEDRKSCFCLESYIDHRGLHISIEVHMILRNGPNFHLVQLPDQMDGDLAKCLNTIPELTSNREPTGPGLYKIFSYQTPKIAYSKDRFDYVSKMIRFMVKDIDTGITVVEDVTTDQGLITYRYDHATQVLTVKFSNPTSILDRLGLLDG